MTDLDKLYKDLVHHDSHFRQNAVRFLSQYYIKEYSNIKKEHKEKIIDGMLSKLNKNEDSLEVKQVTVREFGKMAKYLKEEETIKIFNIIINFIIDEKVEGKDIYVLCIKELLKQLAASSYYVVGKTIIPVIVNGIQHKDNTIKELSYDTFNEYLNKYNYVLIRESDQIIKNKKLCYSSALETLKIDSLTLRKVCSFFIGNISAILNKDELHQLVNSLLKMIEKDSCMKSKITYFNTLTLIVRNAASKIAPYYDAIYPALQKYCDINKLIESSNLSSDDYDLANENAEACLNLAEMIILKLNNLVRNNHKDVLKMIIELVFYNPKFVEGNDDVVDNYNYDDYDYDYDYMGNFESEDSSWRVRRAAVKCISAFTKARITIEHELSGKVLLQLVTALKEKEENTKEDIINCISDLLDSFVFENPEADSTQTLEMLSFTKKSSSLTNKRETINTLIEKLNDLITNSCKSHKICLSRLIASLASVEPSDLLEKFGEFSKSLETNIFNDSSEAALSVMKIFYNALRGFLTSEELKDSYYKHIIYFLDLGLKHSYYKVNIESAQSICLLINAISQSYNLSDLKAINKNIYTAILPKFKLNDIDQELKASLVKAAGHLLKNSGQYLEKETISNILEIFYEKNSNENLRSLIFALLTKTLKENSQLKLGAYIGKYLDYILNHSIKYNIQVQYQSLELLSAIIEFSSESLNEKLVEQINSILLHTAKEDSLLNIIYEIFIKLYKLKIKASIVESSILSTIEIINTRPNIHSETIFEFLNQSIKLIDAKTASNNILNPLLSYLKDLSSATNNKSKCLSIISVNIGKEDLIIKSIIEKLLDSKTKDDNKKGALLYLGDVCVRSNKNFTEVYEIVEKIIGTCSEDLKSFASVCLGKIAVHNLSIFVNSLLKVKPNLIAFYFFAARQCLNELSKKGNVSPENSKVLFLLLDILVQNTKNNDEKVRTLSGESLGFLSLISEEFLKEVLALLNKDSEVKAYALFALKGIFASEKYDAKNLSSAFNTLITGLSDKDILIRTMAYNSLTNFAHNYFEIIKSNHSYLDEILASFDVHHKQNPDLVETIDLGGGVKIKNDKGLSIRKNIFSTIKILEDHIPEKMKFDRIIKILLEGLKDVEDVYNIAFTCLKRQLSYSSGAFISVIDQIVEIFSARLKNLKTIKDAGKDTGKKLNTFSEEVARFCNEISNIPEIAENPKFNEFKYNNEKILEQLNKEEEKQK